MQGCTLKTTVGFAGLLVVALSLAVMAGDAAAVKSKTGPKWSEQSKGVQRQFQRQTKHWVKIGDKLWSIEVMHEAKRRAKLRQAAAYQDASAPWFYEPISGTRCRTLDEVIKKSSDVLALNSGWRVICKAGDMGLMMKRSRLGTVIVTGLPDETTVTSLPKGYMNKTGHVEYTDKKGLTKPYDQYEFHAADVFPEPVTPKQLFDYFVSKQVKKFPVWRVKITKKQVRRDDIGSVTMIGQKTTKLIDKYEWINYPRQVRF